MSIKENTRWMARCLMVFAVIAFCIGRSKDNDNTTEQPTPPIEQSEKTAADVLANIPGVNIIQNTKDANKRDITTFYFDQPIDHNDASAGTFRQYCVLHYKGRDCVTVLHT